MRKQLLALLGSAALILWLGQCTEVDRMLARWSFDPASNGFLWRDHWLTATLGHDIVKAISTLFGAAVIGLAAWDLLRPLTRLDAWGRLRLRCIALAAILVPLAVSLLKRASASHCPWDIDEFGGAERYVRLLDLPFAGASMGHCMPGGHASSVLWMVSLAVCWLPHRPRAAARAALLVMGAGFGAGWVQQLRGAHFLTHTLWSMWIAAAICLVVWNRLVCASRSPATTVINGRLNPAPD